MKFSKIKKHLAILGVLSVVFAVGFGTRSFLPDKIATVDFQQVISSSKELRILNEENDAKMKNFSGWIDVAKKQISAEKNKAKREELRKTYSDVARHNEEEMKKNYREKFIKIDEKINHLIEKVAKSHGCKNVFLKNTVVLGGIDITQEVIKNMNP